MKEKDNQDKSNYQSENFDLSVKKTVRKLSINTSVKPDFDTY